MAFCLRTSLSKYANTNMFLTVFRAHCQQRYLVSSSQHFLSLQPPKKPAGAFLKFLNQKKPEIISKCPDATQLEQCRIAGQLWRDLDFKEKDRLKHDAKEELQVYHQKYLIYMDQLTDQEKAQLQQERRERRTTRALRRHKMELQRLGRPRKPPNSFNLFVKTSRLQQSHAEPPDFLKGLVKTWKQMSEEKKEVYRLKAVVEKERYKLEMLRWEQRMKEIGREDVIRKKSQTKQTSSSSAKSASARK